MNPQGHKAFTIGYQVDNTMQCLNLSDDCYYPIHTCAGINSNQTTNGLCVDAQYDCSGMTHISTSDNTCTRQFQADGTSDAAICCSTQTANGPSGTPTPVLPSASVKNPCLYNTCITALGPIKVGNEQELFTKLFQIILSLAGGVALILIIYSGFNFSMSQGNPEKVQAAKETLTSAIIGLVFIILSVTILQIIGVDILRLPGFSK